MKLKIVCPNHKNVLSKLKLKPSIIFSFDSYNKPINVNWTGIYEKKI